MYPEWYRSLFLVTLNQTSLLLEECMKFAKWMIAGALGVFTLGANPTISLGQGHSHGKSHDKHGEDGDRGEHYYRDHDRDALPDWYEDHRNELPPGLAKKDQLPPGLEKQLVPWGTLPPGLQKHLQPCSEDPERRLPPPPPGCAHVLIGGHIVLMNRHASVVVDIFHLEVSLVGGGA
jgi:hypothetical protein